MPEQKDQELQMPKHLSEIKGTKAEQLKMKTQLISKFGYDAWVALVARSGSGTKL